MTGILGVIEYIKLRMYLVRLGMLNSTPCKMYRDMTAKWASQGNPPCVRFINATPQRQP